MERLPSPSRGPDVVGRPRPCMKEVRWGGTLGPNIFKSNRPETASIASRIASASRRRRGMWESSTLFGSIWFALAEGVDDIRYVADSTIERCIFLIDHPPARNSSASQSRSFGCEGGL